MYYLPNHKAIDEEGLMSALCDTDPACRYFLDAGSGEIGCVDSGDKEKIGKVSADKRYFEVPKISEREQTKQIKDFAGFLSFDEDGVSLQRGLFDALEKGESLKACIKMIEEDPSGWVHGWVQWRSDYILEKAEAWFSTLPIEISDDWELDDDCELCKLLKRGEHTKGDFNEALAKENRKRKESSKENGI
jgi:hypothetical protein